MNKSKRLIFFGTEDFSADSLKALAENHFPVLTVITKPDMRVGRGRKLASPKVKDIALKNGIPVLQPAKASEIMPALATLKPDYGVLVSYGKILPRQIIETFPHGIINVHPSLLPKFRGPTPIEAAILNGDEQTGISLMRLSPQMDEGPVFAQKTVKVDDDDDQVSLSSKLSKISAQFLIEQLPLILSGELPPQAQDESKASYTALLKKEDGQIDWTESPQVIARKVRAYLKYPKAKAEVFNRSIAIIKGRPVSSDHDGDLVVKAGDGFFEIQRLIAPSGRTMSGADFTRGYLKRPAGQ